MLSFTTKVCIAAISIHAFPRTTAEANLPALNIVRAPSSAAIFAPIQQIISPAIAVAIDIDPFDTKNATLCWKTRACTKVKMTAEEAENFYDMLAYQDDEGISTIGMYSDRDLYMNQCEWVKCPAAMPVECGLGCGISKESCQLDIYNQVSSAAEVAFNVGQIVMSVMQNGNPAGQILKSIGFTHWLAEAGERLAAEALRHMIAGKIGEDAAEKLAQQIIGRAVGSNTTVDWTVADPTGVSQVVKSFWKPRCASS